MRIDDKQIFKKNKNNTGWIILAFISTQPQNVTFCIFCGERGPGKQKFLGPVQVIMRP